MKKKTIRVGMQVRSIYDPERVFTLDRSIQPARIFREKGARRWWTSQELQSVLEQPMKLSACALKRAAKIRSEAFLRTPNGVTSKSKREYRHSCLNCGTEFTSQRKKAKFCKTRGAGCRAEYWKRRNLPPEVPKERMRSEKGIDAENASVV